MSFYDKLTEKEKALLDDVKNGLDYTFSDEDMDKKIMNSIQCGIERLNDIAGCELDYNLAGGHKTLLLNYCRYDMAGKSDEFERNYRSQIVTLQIDKEIGAYAEKNGF